MVYFHSARNDMGSHKDPESGKVKIGGVSKQTLPEKSIQLSDSNCN
jgi:hypothetical protein